MKIAVEVKGFVFNLIDYINVITLQDRFARNYKRSAFTLAEVLVTLAIIGIVAVLIIPALVRDYQARVWDTSSKVFTRKLEEALKVMNTQQTLAGYRSTEDFVSELSKHFKITKICKNDDIMSCFEDKVNVHVLDILNPKSNTSVFDMSDIKTAYDLGKDKWPTETIGLQLANGVTGIIAYDPECKQNPYDNNITGLNCISIVYDTDGFKKPNTFGKDVRVINSTFGQCLFNIGSACLTAMNDFPPLTYAECMELKGDLGIKSCCPDSSCYGRDYWGGAAKACGGADKIPTLEQLAKVADYVYNTSGIGAMESITSGLTLDRDKVAQLGVKTSASGSFTIWSEEANESTTRQRDFSSDRSYSGMYVSGRNIQPGSGLFDDTNVLCVR